MTLVELVAVFVAAEVPVVVEGGPQGRELLPAMKQPNRPGFHYCWLLQSMHLQERFVFHPWPPPLMSG